MADALTETTLVALTGEALGLALGGAARRARSTARRNACATPLVALSEVRPMEHRVASSVAAQRTSAMLAGLFAGVAVMLTAIGTYGLLSYAVAQRRREIGVRLALGARPSQICTQFVTLALRLLAVGLVLGLLGSWWAGMPCRPCCSACLGFIPRRSSWRPFS